MDQNLDEQICKECPNLYSQRNGDLRTTAMCWGFECNSGWFKIIYELSKELEAEILKLPESEREYTCASQVKEKYGILRFYMHSETDEMSYLIREAEQKSSITCEICGKEGELRGFGWLRTVCEEHSQGESTYEQNIKEFEKANPRRKQKESLSNKLYFITRWFKYPKMCLDDIKQDIKWNLWKLKRKIRKLYVRVQSTLNNN